jgi:hypothetical protein
MHAGMHSRMLPPRRACHHILASSKSKNDVCPIRYNLTVNKWSFSTMERLLRLHTATTAFPRRSCCRRATQAMTTTTPLEPRRTATRSVKWICNGEQTQAIHATVSGCSSDIPFQPTTERFFQHFDDTNNRFSPFTFIITSSIYLSGAPRRLLHNFE